MKNFYIQTIVLLFVVLAGFTSKTNAQFASSSEVYCYQFYKTIDNEVVSKDRSSGDKYYDVAEVVFVFFGGEWAGFSRFESVEEASQKMLSDPSFGKNEAIKDAQNHSVSSKCCFRYYNAFSTSSKVTYRRWCSAGQYIDPYAIRIYNSPDRWDKICLSFSLDKSEMIWWLAENPNKRYYFKRINPNSLKPNLDFLD